MPSTFQFKAANTVHHAVLKITGGRFGWNLEKMPVIELTTTGRKSGKLRTVMLTSPLREGTTIVVVGSAGGEDHDPAWVHNVRANPDVQIAMKGAPKQARRARVATPDERARMWPKIAADFKNYGDYQTKTSREIPLVLLEVPTA